jgi:hypothetical protein
MPQIPDHYQGGIPYRDIEAEDLTPAYDQAEQRFFTASEHPDVVALRGAIQHVGMLVDVLVPPGRNKALALTALEDVQMRANRAIFAPEHLR